MFFANFIKAIILGIVEGITEWLPISSTGHLILVDNILKMQISKEFTSMFNVVIQLGAIMAVVYLYFNKLNPFDQQKSKLEQKQTWDLWLKVVVACFPSAIIGLLFDDWLDAHLYKPFPVALMLIIYGIGFIWVENRNRNIKPKCTDLNRFTYKAAIMIGVFQVLALIPGTSRSGATILGGILIGASRYVAAEFSFFLGIPTMFGASGLKIFKFIKNGNFFDLQSTFILLTGMIVSFIVSVLVIKFLMDYIKKHDFSVFGWYRIILGSIIILTMIF
ncbi:undecaprenyl-diphosphate phosphatase [Enterococcus cecorum]|uniref:undecaprenyl-diphosphate phosphatase n=2 Tax=Enterococcus cecorum TaxID=44008 RepID=UPI00148DA53F|nr:undecaprenyl-diphosphate phosphatase [Enterococcus cecorum]MCJ0572688.1 undecaprenyl-diphosphate phosphatase [Enterococcus cecorum]MCJ0581465.1 undecaprenyl-diphosphate phosphatase [Enterococcus cecorum]MCJ0590022.1 undecaprenyl-diphosphate phosphatase [Enterococcus cecorum]MCJ0606512.1 undecaprenyl-diphosphate phosphatase [Enterococcus cecorum]MDZ5559968.1 undecaprenyl-diphosphate phosphatase [Enterococcus cecorum]